MGMIIGEIGIGAESIGMKGYAGVASDESLAQRSDVGTTGSTAQPDRKPLEAMPDQEYVRSMEERYGIREEGVL